MTSSCNNQNECIKSIADDIAALKITLSHSYMYYVANTTTYLLVVSITMLSIFLFYKCKRFIGQLGSPVNSAELRGLVTDFLQVTMMLDRVRSNLDEVHRMSPGHLGQDSMTRSCACGSSDRTSVTQPLLPLVSERAPTNVGPISLQEVISHNQSSTLGLSDEISSVDDSSSKRASTVVENIQLNLARQIIRLGAPGATTGIPKWLRHSDDVHVV